MQSILAEWNDEAVAEAMQGLRLWYCIRKQKKRKSPTVTQ